MAADLERALTLVWYAAHAVDYPSSRTRHAALGQLAGW